MAAELVQALADQTEVRKLLLDEGSQIILRSFLKIVQELVHQVSESCLGHCLQAIAILVKNTDENTISVLLSPEYS